MEPKQNDEMYAEWATINICKILDENKWSILHKLPHINGQSVVNAVVKPLANRLNRANGFSTSANSASLSSTTSTTTLNSPSIDDSDYTSYLTADRDVQWVMEVICYGLSLQIFTSEQHEAVKDCVTIYCEWMYAVLPNKSETKLIPFPIRDDPNIYFRRMVQHLYNIFIPRNGTSMNLNITGNQDFNVNDVVKRQVLLCHRVLRTLQDITEDESNKMDSDSWDMLLMFLLAVNDIILAPPPEKDDKEFCQRVVSVLFDVWIIACHRCFPSPSFWKTFMQLCRNWRHRLALIEQWSKVCVALTQRQMQLTYDCDVRVTSFSDSGYVNVIVQEMSYDIISQTWYRLLHILGNPVELCAPEIISKTEKFYHYASESVVDPRQHPCLNILPRNFHCAMKGLASIIDTFLGIQTQLDFTDTEASKRISLPSNVQSSVVSSQPLTPPHHRKPAFKSVTTSASKVSHKPGSHILTALTSNKASVATSQTQSNSQPPATIQTTTQQSAQSRPVLCMSPSRPRIASVLNVIGKWLFGACLIGSEHFSLLECHESACETHQFHNSNEMASRRKPSLGISVSGERINIEISLSIENFETGQAEAMGALCRLFASKKTNEDIPAAYLARFYLCLQHGLSIKPIHIQCLSSIILNSTKLFQLNLNGINLLIPHFLKAMDTIIGERDAKYKNVDLRRSSISILLSLLSYPLHFTDLAIKDCLAETASPITFHSLRPRLISLMINALQTETDSTNAQMLLAGFLLCVQDAALYEKDNGNVNHIDGRSRQSPFTSEHTSLESPENSASSHSELHSHEGDTISTEMTEIHFGKRGIPDTAMGLFARTLYLVCHLLTSSWKNDTQVSLAALEMLSGLARIKFKSVDNTFNFDECKRATKWVCDYIVNQCSRPPPFHSRDMHSAIVAAYQCLTVWFHEHSYLLNDRECVNTLIEVIELGICGSKSRLKDTLLLKSQKELKPASMRVREAAELLQTYLMNHFGYSQSAPCPPDSTPGCSLVNELCITKYLGIETSVNTTFEEACKHFKYYVVEGSIIFSFVNDRLSNRTICLIRSPFGKYCWSFKYQLLPSNSNKTCCVEEVPRPLPIKLHPKRNHVPIRHFPESIDRIPATTLDNVIPTIETFTSSCEQKEAHSTFLKIVDKQLLVEKSLQKQCLLSVNYVECKQPMPVTELETSRLILSHFGYLTLDHQFSTVSQGIPSLLTLDNKNAELANDLKILDLISIRTSDTVFVFYVRKGRLHPQEILNSVMSREYVGPQFMEFLNSVGVAVNASEHCGWTGKIETSWKVNDDRFGGELNADHGGFIYDGIRMSLYWADASHEIAFIVPSGPFVEEDKCSLDLDIKNRTRSMDSDHALDHRSLSSCSDDGTSASSHSRTYSDADSTRSSQWRRKNTQLSLLGNVGCDTKVLVIWLENLEDETNVPIR
ncbi:Ral GTPase-activating protein subunit beta-like protein [Leptotrombidium deliense]|uniref:Ral GTPase-activating protein subunit beta-like protein n=1 Tax=Leptotrombidium deliense TaxID=299467 RepID=A0A443SJS0_9ACAR|nr:Ral GTPase-activating protein subunit beta-like protein [Leptotrombidium deliense]